MTSNWSAVSCVAACMALGVTHNVCTHLCSNCIVLHTCPCTTPTLPLSWKQTTPSGSLCIYLVVSDCKDLKLSSICCSSAEDLPERGRFTSPARSLHRSLSAARVPSFPADRSASTSKSRPAAGISAYTGTLLPHISYVSYELHTFSPSIMTYSPSNGTPQRILGHTSPLQPCPTCYTYRCI